MKRRIVLIATAIAVIALAAIPAVASALVSWSGLH
jgi:hypothetical protein